MLVSVVAACNSNGNETDDTTAPVDDNNNDIVEDDDQQKDEDLSNTPVGNTAIDAPRVLLVTDFHYTAEVQGIYYGIDKDVRMTSMVKAINEEHAKDPLEAVFFLGDSSLDHWQWNVGGSWLAFNTSYTKLFLDKYRAQLPSGLPLYFAPGNHEQFSNEQWKTITGNERNFSVVIGDYLFLVWDSFGLNLDPDYHHDGAYSSINYDWAKQCADQNPGKKILLISHWVNKDDTITGGFVSDYDVKAMFVGHDHAANVTKVFSKPVIHCGNYSYYGSSTPDDAEKYMWGFRDLYLFGNKIYSRYIVPDNTANPSGKTISVVYHYQDEYEEIFN